MIHRNELFNKGTDFYIITNHFFVMRQYMGISTTQCHQGELRSTWLQAWSDQSSLQQEENHDLSSDS